MSKAPILGHCDNRPRIHIWQHASAPDFRFSFGPTGFHSRQPFRSIGEAVGGAEMHAGGFRAGAVIIVEPRQ